MSWRPTIRQLLLGLSAAILGTPLLGVFFLPVFDAYLLRQTERILIAESNVIGEAWRERWLEARGGGDGPEPRIEPPGREGERFTPYAAVLDLDYRVLQPQSDPTDPVEPLDPAKARAGRAIAPMLARAQRFNLSGVRVLDERGCAVASSGGPPGGCLGDREEVRRALAGEYAAVVRRRYSDEPTPPITSIRRRGNLRVFTAVPVFSDGRVVAVVRMSRTAVSPLEAAWTHRGKIAWVGLLCLVVTPALAFALTRSIASPVRQLRAGAEAVARGEPREPLDPDSLTPRELVALSDAVDRMTDQLTERARYIHDFATQVSHELKTPIAAIAGAVELLREQAEGMSEAQRERFLANVAADAERMDRLVRRLLQLARIQSVGEDAESIDVAKFLESMRGRAPERIRVAIEPDLPPLVMTPDHLETAVGNLLDNALRHGEERPVELRARRRGERVEIQVLDRGPGIRDAQRERIFERFYTTERDRGGTGLGLALVRAVAESRGGSVELESREGRTRFSLVL